VDEGIIRRYLLNLQRADRLHGPTVWVSWMYCSISPVGVDNHTMFFIRFPYSDVDTASMSILATCRCSASPSRG
jgi:hypothetical protein